MASIKGNLVNVEEGAKGLSEVPLFKYRVLRIATQRKQDRERE